jgi:hypothetical protein
MDNCSIYLYSLSPVYNVDKVPQFAGFSLNDSSYLYRNLLRSSLEILSKLNNSTKLIICLHEEDKEFVPAEVLSQYDIEFIRNNQTGINFHFLNQKYFSKSENNILLFSNTIGFTESSLRKYYELLNVDDNVFIVAKSENGKAGIISFNVMPDILNTTNQLDISYDSFLKLGCKSDSSLFVVDSPLVISNLDDFRKLYHELSKKESILYCSHEMHERFTNLFIEYKELL